MTFRRHGYPLDHSIKKMYHSINRALWKQFERGEISREQVIYSRFVDLFQAAGIEGDGRAFEDEYQEELGRGAFLLPARRRSAHIAHNSATLYIVTNGVSRTQYSRLRDSGLDRYMKGIFVSEDAGYQKPMKEYFDYVFARIPGFQAEKTLIVGDSLSSDIRGGNNAGIDTCWYCPRVDRGSCGGPVIIRSTAWML
ncbi:MAG: YjjG family noncanonical pyrimidine nucleotidase [Christensenellales bacterium]